MDGIEFGILGEDADLPLIRRSDYGGDGDIITVAY